MRLPPRLPLSLPAASLALLLLALLLIEPLRTRLPPPPVGSLPYVPEEAGVEVIEEELWERAYRPREEHLALGVRCWRRRYQPAHYKEVGPGRYLWCRARWVLRPVPCKGQPPRHWPIAHAGATSSGTAASGRPPWG